MARVLLWTFVAALIVTALLVLALIVDPGGLSEGTVRVLLLACATACAALLAMAGEAALRFPGAKALGRLTLVAAAGAYVLIAWLILGEWRPERFVVRLMWTAATMASALGLGCALVFVPLLEGWRIVRAGTIFFLAGTCVGILWSLWSSRDTGQLIAACAILFLVGSVLVLVGRDQSRKAMVTEEAGVKVPRCPHCGETLPKDLADVFH